MLNFLLILAETMLNVDLIKMFLCVWVVLNFIFKDPATVTKVLLTIAVASSVFNLAIN